MSWPAAGGTFGNPIDVPKPEAVAIAPSHGLTGNNLPWTKRRQLSPTRTGCENSYGDIVLFSQEGARSTHLQSLTNPETNQFSQPQWISAASTGRWSCGKYRNTICWLITRLHVSLAAYLGTAACF